MAIKRITISVPEALADKIKEAAGETSVSAWVTALIERELEDEHLDRLWEEHIASVEITPEARAWAQRVIDSAVSPRDEQAAHGSDAA